MHIVGQATVSGKNWKVSFNGFVMHLRIFAKFQSPNHKTKIAKQKEKMLQMMHTLSCDTLGMSIIKNKLQFKKAV